MDALAATTGYLITPLLVVSYVVAWELAGTLAAITTCLVIALAAFALMRKYD